VTLVMVVNVAFAAVLFGLSYLWLREYQRSGYRENLGCSWLAFGIAAVILYLVFR